MGLITIPIVRHQLVGSGIPVAIAAEMKIFRIRRSVLQMIGHPENTTDQRHVFFLPTSHHGDAIGVYASGCPAPSFGFPVLGKVCGREGGAAGLRRHSHNGDGGNIPPLRLASSRVAGIGSRSRARPGTGLLTRGVARPAGACTGCCRTGPSTDTDIIQTGGGAGYRPGGERTIHEEHEKAHGGGA